MTILGKNHFCVKCLKFTQKQRKSTENMVFSVLFGGDKRDRTADLLNAIQALSQLSYTPIFAAFQSACVLYQYSCGLSRGFYKKCKKSFRGVFKVEDGGRTVGVIPYDARTLPGAVYPHQSRERVRREKDDRPGGRSLRGAGG